ncbi:hypothetical protein X961_5256 [Burkholderia pseudomallei MSHR5613]|nr:hypothetical protein DO73_3360 [Burkholderia pseudomallei]KGR95842.1 hypothetical protein X948_4905 [Burkholderia pseudomallei MSHR5608]KGS26355.1 hypothetical protein X962_4283 [Burkholderia pseudomallei MSHR7343]KGS29842.1 hypothetical protein X941_3176 [Burkholderia pseudomallei MSHR5569]KGS42331.1 hypothetical protein X961_5256 [Burkholderia pseudomallei MSHR5613]KGS48200.1 hypothetical protein X945_2462 [Burkholderia pseudomallei ABCPW 107]KGS68542.1 hypothetical protein X979_4608 [Bu
MKRSARPVASFSLNDRRLCSLVIGALINSLIGTIYSYRKKQFNNLNSGFVVMVYEDWMTMSNRLA